LPADFRGSKSRPQEVTTGDEAQRTDERHPDAGDNVDATLGEGADTAPLNPPSSQESVEAKGEGDEPGNGEEEPDGEGRAHAGASNGARSVLLLTG
jgi:hypothetical protein